MIREFGVSQINLMAFHWPHYVAAMTQLIWLVNISRLEVNFSLISVSVSGVLPIRHNCNYRKIRWSLAAHDICFTKSYHSQLFMHGMCRSTNVGTLRLSCLSRLEKTSYFFLMHSICGICREMYSSDSWRWCLPAGCRSMYRKAGHR